jgi:Prokaryotic E2 family A/ThiF family/Prokaryotic homologs of the JAB domain
MTMPAIQHAVAVLQRHPALMSVEQPQPVAGGVEVAVTVAVSLPSRFQAEGVTPNGIRAKEPCWLLFPTSWPMRAPRAWLREDFPSDLPHINPHHAGQRVNPCLFEGSLDEVLHRFGLERIIDQLSDWLTKAASGQLINLQQGWEPTRRDSAPSTVVFSAEDAIVKVPLNGEILAVQGRYFEHDEVLLAVASEAMEAALPSFSEEHRQHRTFKYAIGDVPFFFARCVDESGTPRVVSVYAPETVGDLESLLEKASSLGAKTDEIKVCLKRYAQEKLLRGNWTQGVIAVVVLLVHRPAPLVGAPGRSIEMLPYVVKFSGPPFSPVSQAHPAFHSHRISPALLSLASGLAVPMNRPKIVMLGCGSLGSKVALHLGRAGLGNMAFVDNEAISPHNGARHALIPPRHMVFNPNKVALMEDAFFQLGHEDCMSHPDDAAEVLMNEQKADEVIGLDSALIVDTTASLRVAAAASASLALTKTSSRRFIQAGMYASGKVAYLFAEGAARTVTTDDLRARLFELCRHDQLLRKLLGSDGSDATRIFVGDNCRSLTMPMTDSKVSRAASLVGGQLEIWLAGELPALGQLCVGLEDEAGIGMSWVREELEPPVVLIPREVDGWTVRVLASVANAIDVDAKQQGLSETGGALIGHIMQSTRTIIVAGLIDAPPDSVRSPSTFILGTRGLVSALKAANSQSLGHLHFVGTWHSHPMGGSHSGLDRETLGRIAGDAQGLPAVSLVWTPQGFVVAVDQL